MKGVKQVGEKRFNLFNLHLELRAVRKIRLRYIESTKLCYVITLRSLRPKY
jgi:hypothetical protein